MFYTCKNCVTVVNIRFTLVNICFTLVNIWFTLVIILFTLVKTFYSSITLRIGNNSGTKNAFSFRQVHPKSARNGLWEKPVRFTLIKLRFMLVRLRFIHVKVRFLLVKLRFLLIKLRFLLLKLRWTLVKLKVYTRKNINRLWEKPVRFTLVKMWLGIAYCRYV